MIRTIVLCLALAACGPRTIMVPQIQIERITPPVELLTCPEEPRVPDGPMTLNGLALHHIDVAEAGEDCRRRLKAVNEWVRK
jgi:hypothetical protein